MKTPKLTLISQKEEPVTKIVYQIDYNGITYYHTDLIAPEGNIIDSYIRDIYGHLVEDPEIVHTIVDFLDHSLEPKN